MKINYENAQRMLDIYAAVNEDDVPGKSVEIWHSANVFKSNIDKLCNTLGIDPAGKDTRNLILYILEGVYMGKLDI